MLLASHGAILLVGVAIGAWVAVDRVTRANALLDDIAVMERMSFYVHAQRVAGDDRAYEAALKDLLSYLEDRRSKPALIADERVIATDVALTHTRLALLAERRGNTDDAEEYFAEALVQCPATFLKSCSVDDLRRMVLELDAKMADANAERK
jgi:hypothetical protein